MKNNLGKVLTILILVWLDLSAKEYTWSAFISKDKAYVNEAVYLKYVCEFDSTNELHVIEFNPVGVYKDYVIHLLSEKEKIVNDKRVNEFEYIAFLKRSGLIEFNFDVMMKKTNKDSIENTVLGRDNADYEQFSKTLIKQTPLSINVFENKLDLVGNYSFSIKKDDFKVKAYEPYHFEILIQGNGNLDHLKVLDLNISGAKVFSSKAKKNYSLTKEGYQGSWSQKFAVVSQKNFVFPQITYEYFDPKDAKRKIFVHKAFEIETVPLYKQEDLLDTIEEVPFIFKKEYLYYILSFVFGFLVAKIDLRKKVIIKNNNNFKKKVQMCKNMEELLLLLIITDASHYSDIIKKIESKELSLSQAKKLLK